MPRKTSETQSQQPQTVEVELDLTHFTNKDFETLLEWQTKTGEHEIKEVFDLLDKIVVGGFRSLPFMQNSAVIPQILQQILNIAKGEAAKN